VSWLAFRSGVPFRSPSVLCSVPVSVWYPLTFFLVTTLSGDSGRGVSWLAFRSNVLFRSALVLSSVTVSVWYLLPVFFLTTLSVLASRCWTLLRIILHTLGVSRMTRLHRIGREFALLFRKIRKARVLPRCPFTASLSLLGFFPTLIVVRKKRGNEKMPRINQTDLLLYLCARTTVGICSLQYTLVLNRLEVATGNWIRGKSKQLLSYPPGKGFQGFRVSEI
jgi:hypothetical protein